MYKIIIKGKSGEVDPVNFPKEKYQEIVDSAYEDTDFTEYFHRSYNFGGGQKRENQQKLIDKGVNSGYMSFKLIDGEIWTVTEYLSPYELDDDELQILKDYTQGQWSDGVGEGFEQHPIMEYEGEDVYLSPWHREQELEVEQKEIDGSDFKDYKISNSDRKSSTPSHWEDQGLTDNLSDLLKSTKELLKKLGEKDIDDE